MASSALMILTSCSGLNPLSFLTGGGPNVNGQIGATNNQGLNVNTAAPSVSLKPNARVDTIDQSQGGVKADRIEKVVNNDNSILLIVIAILGWLAPSPKEMARWVRELFKKDKK